MLTLVLFGEYLGLMMIPISQLLAEKNKNQLKYSRELVNNQIVK